MNARRQVVTILLIFAVCVATAWIWAWPSKADTGSSSESSVTVVAEAPQCQQWVAGWVSVPASCDATPLPAIVRKCIGSAVVGMILAYLTGGTSIVVGGGTGLMGCIPWAND